MSGWDANELLRYAHERIGGVGLDISTFGEDGQVIVRWKRLYGEVLSDEREIIGLSLVDGLRGVVDYENTADAAEESES